MAAETTTEIRKIVQDHYGAVARTGDPAEECCAGGSYCAPESLYPAEMLAAVPAGAAQISLGCGNPFENANLQPGETVVDLGSGGGIDCFLAAQRVGPAGRVIGVDMTLDMIAKATANLKALRESDHGHDYANVEFRQGFMEALPIEDNSVDLIISNCVINLAPDKAPVFREMLRVLKPGGRVNISDLVTRGEMSAEVRADQSKWVECIAGALPAAEFERGLRAAGFERVRVDADANLDVNVDTLDQGLPYSAIISAYKTAG